MKPRVNAFFQHQRSLFHQNGSSVLMIILSLGFGFLILIGHMQTQADSSLKHLKISKMHKREIENFKAELNFILNSNNGCKANFSGVRITSFHTNASPVTVRALYYGNGSVRGSAFLDLDRFPSSTYRRLDFKNMSLSAHPTKFGADGAGVHLALLSIHGETTAREFFPVLPIYVNTDASGNIIGCRSTAYVDKDADGNDLTLEEKLCTDPVPPAQTGNWPADCIECLGTAENYFMCISCKKQGKVYDSAAAACV